MYENVAVFVHKYPHFLLADLISILIVRALIIRILTISHKND